MWMGISEADERAAFKRTANGYVFQAPSRWLIGPARHYLVDEARKDELVNLLAQIRLRRAHAVILIVATALAGLTIPIYFRAHPILAAACGFALLVAFVVAVGFRQLAALQPLLADLPRTAERISWRDRLAAASATTSPSQLMMLGLGCTAFSLVSALQLVGYMARADGNMLSVRPAATGTAAIFFAAIAVTNFVTAYVKLKNRPRRDGYPASKER